MVTHSDFEDLRNTESSEAKAMHVSDVIDDNSSIGRYGDFFFPFISEDPLKRASRDGIAKIDDDMILREHISRTPQSSETLNVTRCRNSKDSSFAELSPYEASPWNGTKSYIEVDRLRSQIAPPILRDQIQCQLGIFGNEQSQRYRRNHTKKNGVNRDPQNTAGGTFVIQCFSYSILKRL